MTMEMMMNDSWRGSHVYVADVGDVVYVVDDEDDFVSGVRLNSLEDVGDDVGAVAI